ncbi:MAG: ribonuclease N [Weeksellaceae bacterium]|nr:ribonuclease N [Weeksellaceae bacterium]
MNKDKIKLILFFVIGLLTAFLVMYLLNNYRVEKKQQPDISANSQINDLEGSGDLNNRNNKTSTSLSGNIEELTAETKVISYVKANSKLPDYYMTKGEARAQGWVASDGNLCEVLPGRAIGGDKFSNREKQLPKGNQYFEADVNYNCGNRNADRIVFTKSGDVWLTKNHYKSFEKQ